VQRPVDARRIDEDNLPLRIVPRADDPRARGLGLSDTIAIFADDRFSSVDFPAFGFEIKPDFNPSSDPSSWILHPESQS
jgi:hypothetical protein